MNFALSKKFSTIDFEEVNLADLMLIGGGCGGGGGGGGSTTVTASNAQQVAQASASPSGTSVNINVSTPGGSVTWGGSYSYTRTGGLQTSGNFQVTAQTGNVSATVNHQSGGSWWSSFTSWVSSWFGS
jgi:hypothetical protein